jgi:hypothetical protein
MDQTLTLSGEVYERLARGAAEHGMTVESLLACVSRLIVSPADASKRDRLRSESIARLLDRFRAGALNSADHVQLGQLIDDDAAIARADERIRAKKSRASNASGGKHGRK